MPEMDPRNGIDKDWSASTGKRYCFKLPGRPSDQSPSLGRRIAHLTPNIQQDLQIFFALPLASNDSDTLLVAGYDYVFCGFFRAAGKRILFRIKRYPGEVG